MSTHLPFELWHLILKLLRPVIQQDTKDSASNLDAFNRKLKRYASLRLVCVEWHKVITPILYEETIIVIRSPTDFPCITNLFERGAQYMKSVIIYGHFGWYHPPFQNGVEAVGRGLGLCTRIRNLECYSMHPTFIDQEWLSTYAPNLASTITSLAIDLYTPRDISYSLVALGRSLQRLELLGMFDRNKIPLYLPSAFPNLTHLTFRDCSFSDTQIRQLLSCIVPSKGEVALRSISVLGRVNCTHLFDSILAISRVGNHITSLHLGTPSYYHPIRVEQRMALQRCSKLLEISLTINNREALDYLPITIQTLELGILSGSLITFADLEMFFKSRRCPMLHAFSLHIYGIAQLDETAKASLRSACNEVGVDIAITSQPLR